MDIICSVKPLYVANGVSAAPDWQTNVDPAYFEFLSGYISGGHGNVHGDIPVGKSCQFATGAFKSGYNYKIVVTVASDSSQYTGHSTQCVITETKVSR